jgi:hypothetical protein
MEQGDGHSISLLSNPSRPAFAIDGAKKQASKQPLVVKSVAVAVAAAAVDAAARERSAGETALSQPINRPPCATASCLDSLC